MNILQNVFSLRVWKETHRKSTSGVFSDQRDEKERGVPVTQIQAPYIMK